MEYLVLTAVLLGLVVLVFIRESWQDAKRKKKFRQSLRDNFGKLPTRKYTMENSIHIPGYYQRHQDDGQLDDITWNDLSMDDVFKRMNYTHTATGEEYLYYMLRSVNQSRESLDHFEELVQWFAEHEDERTDIQYVMSELGYTGKYSLYDYIENLDYLGERSNVKEHLLNALYVVLLAMMPFEFSMALAGICVLAVYRIISYFKIKAEVESYIVSFAYVTRLILTAEKVCKLEIPVCDDEFRKVKKILGALKGISRGFYWVSAMAGPKSGNPLEVIMDYGRMLFHPDLIIFNRMLGKLRLNLPQIDELIRLMGVMEATVSVGYFRASLENGWCVPELLEEGCLVEMTQGYHPLLECPVKNTIKADRGVLLTGSNASGKSTFLKTVAINAILAQTVHTCTAESYKAPMWSIYSSMALRDDLGSGESYYIVEIKALKRILDAQKRDEKVLCFVDEVLRGTNTVERIAASTQILKSLGIGDVMCFAATHDIELTELLKEDYDNFHFEEEIKDGDISFQYRLLSGKATSRNAIRLLEIIGYSPEVTEEAMKRAERFLETGVWQA
ncbi:MAG: hypothetical protein E7292_02330 [Lachnospiraceae bacterium]|nr:hypothetical protein [Lachnospiraceae bacterium]